MSEKSKLKTVLLTFEDGEELEIRISEKIHLLLGHVCEGVNKDAPPPMEIIMCGRGSVIGEIFYQMGEQQPELVKHCVRRSFDKIVEKAEKVAAEKGVNLQDEILKNMPTKGGVC